MRFNPNISYSNMNKNNQTRTIPKSVFEEAAFNYFKCQPDDIEIRMITRNKEAFVIYNNEGYKISTREILREDIEYQLADKNAVHHIDFHCWIHATKNTVSLTHIFGPLVRTLQDTEQAKMLLIAVDLASHTEDKEQAFWEILNQIDKEGGLLGKAMVTTAEVYDGPGFVNDLLEHHITNADQIYNRVKGGIFKTVYVGDDQRGHFEFFLYSSDDYFTE